jgi:PQQ-dependent catabolism-associated CXXCW motif protein
MLARTLILATMLLAATAAAQDSFDAAPRQQVQPPQQGGMPEAQPGPGSLPQQDFSQPPTPGPGAPAAGGLEQLAELERQDLGVPPTDRLHAGPMHGPTPAQIPGGQVITTQGLLALIEGRQVPFVLLDVLGAEETIPGSALAVPAHQPGGFDDQVQQEFGAFLSQATAGSPEMPLVLYCLSIHCWMSYNAALRAINLGYTNVLWYRGGLEAWKAAGRQTQAR